MSYTIELFVKKFKQEGDIAWEYNPLRNLKKLDGTITDFTVNNKQLKISLDTPIDIECQQSYDGSVNLILNDDKNPPRIINSRITKLENNRYKIINRNQIHQSNLYEENSLDRSTRLFRNVLKIPKLKLQKVAKFGQLNAGNYIFYLKYLDDDYNQSDFVVETGIISIFNGDPSFPSSCHGAYMDERTDKSIVLYLKNIDTSFTYFNLYFTRCSCDVNGILVKKHYKILRNYEIKGEYQVITITGYEELEDISEEDLNIQYNIVDSVKTQAQVQNRLFFANVNKPSDKDEKIQSLSLDIFAKECQKENENVGWVNPTTYTSLKDNDAENTEYYSPLNIYYKLGYFPGEIYRFGIVYIFNDDHLSPVYNLRGCDFNLLEEDKYNISQDKNGDFNLDVSSDDVFINKAYLENTKGIFRFRKYKNVIQYDKSKVVPIGIQFSFLKSTLDKLKEFNIKGFFFVRQVRIPHFLAQAFSIGVDAESGVPMLRNGFKEDGEIASYFTESFLNGSYTLVTEYTPRIITGKNKASSGFLCVDAYVDRQLQSIFNSSDFKLVLKDGFKKNLDTYNKRIYIPEYDDSIKPEELTGDLLYIDSEIPQRIYNDITFCTKAGVQEELKQVICFDEHVQDKKDFQKYIRGIYTAFVGSTQKFEDNCIYNIYQKSFSESFLEEYFLTRINDKSPFFAISDRYSIDIITTITKEKVEGEDGDLKEKEILKYKLSDDELNFLKDEIKKKVKYNKPVREEFINIIEYNNALIDYIKLALENEIGGFNSEWALGHDKLPEDKSKIPETFEINKSEDMVLVPTTYRGDCFTATVTTRIQRNFTSASVPINDTIIEPNTWKDTFKGARSTEDWANISKADIDAVPIGHWFTYKCLSNKNLGLRSLDPFNTEEMALIGNPRNFYPKYGISTKSSAKIPESNLYNNGYSVTLGYRRNYAFDKIPYTQDEFDTRIMFSNTQVHGSFKNSYKVFQGLSYQDYDRQYGGITKIMPWGANILAVFEHAIAIVPVNEKALIQTTEGQNIHMKGTGVLQDQLTIISDMYGSIWKDSIIRTPRALYGVDTYAKKIWRFSEAKGFELLSDFKVQRYLHDNINLKELEKYVVLGVRNVKTHYNAYKNDIMFTFYNKEKIWNLCYNEISDVWVTRYSWTPLLSENIDNSFFSFDLLKTKIFGIINNNLYKKDEDLLVGSPWNGVWDCKSEGNKLLWFNTNNKYTGYNILGIKIKGYYWNNKLSKISEEELVNKLTKTVIKNIDGEKKSIDTYHFEDLDENNVLIDNEQLKIEIFNVDNNEEVEVDKDDSTLQKVFFEKYKNIKGKTSTVTFKKDSRNPKYLYYTVEVKYLPYIVGTYEGIYKDEDTVISEENKENYLIFNSVVKSYEVGLITNYASIEGTEWENGWNNALLSKIYVHGRANIIDEVNYLDRDPYNQALPTKWYDSQEPFEFEFVVNDPKGVHKIFDNLVIISNNVEPESLEIEIVGDVYDFNKRNIFINANDLNEKIDSNTPETEFTKVEIVESKDSIKRYETEVVWDPILDEYSLKVHQDCLNIKQYGRRLGNIYYNEGSWYTVIQPIYYTLGEDDSLRSTRVRDKYAKIRVKYKGDKLVIITALQTLMTQSYV